MELYDALASSYGDAKSRTKLQEAGFARDDDLSDHRNEVWHNATSNKLLVNVAGTHNKHDVLTDVKLALGRLSSTKRYKSAEKTLNAAKTKYQGAATTITGHSLGGSIAQKVAAKDDTVYAANSGFTFGGKARKGPGAVVRSGWDLVSALGKGQKTISKGSILQPLRNHAVKQFRGKKIYI